MSDFTLINIISILLITAGAGTMIVSMLRFRRLSRAIRLLDEDAYDDIKLYARAPRVFMALFLAGYIAVDIAILTGHAGHSPLLTLIVSAIFAFGALFVFMTTLFQVKMLDHLQASRDKEVYETLHDELTGLANRNLLHDRLQQAIDRSSRTPSNFYSVLFIDLDRFMNINDSLGHAVGDRVLVEVARRLNACVRNLDTVARFGADEFVILLDGTNPRTTIRIMKRIRESLARPVLVRHHSLNISAGVGIYYGPTADDLPDVVLQNAHLALHRAKRLGANRFRVFRTAMLEHAVRAIALEHDLLRGIRKQEFVAYFQPVVSTSEPPELVGFEALARWHHPTKGHVSPLIFIPMAEETGLITDVGREIFTQACEVRQRLLATVPGCDTLHMAVNLSARQLQRPAFAREILDIMDRFGTTPADLVLEITESTFMDTSSVAINRINQLREKGFDVAIDDFGTGYSSFAYLKDLPATHIKIDRAFVRNMVENQSDQEIVRSMIDMGHSLSMQVVAEGIEDEDQLRMLRDFGSDLIQGFHYSKPLPPEEVAGFITAFNETHRPEKN